MSSLWSIVSSHCHFPPLRRAPSSKSSANKSLGTNFLFLYSFDGRPSPAIPRTIITRLLASPHQHGGFRRHQSLSHRKLLEKILINITDTKTILLAQRVDKFWSDIIGKDSTKLQKKLYFEPATHDELETLCMIVRERTLGEDSDTIYSDEDEGPVISNESRPTLVNFARRGVMNFPSTNYALLNTLICGNAAGTVPALRINIPSSAEGADSAACCTPSWMRMMVSQPPATALLVHDVCMRESISGDTVQQILMNLEIFKQSKASHGPNLHLAIDGIAADLSGYERALQKESARPGGGELGSEDEDDYDYGSDTACYDYDDRFDELDALFDFETPSEDSCSALELSY